MKLTGWYKESQKPIRKGYYQCQCCLNKFYWTGKFWTYNEKTKAILGINEGWRGIAK